LKRSQAPRRMSSVTLYRGFNALSVVLLPHPQPERLRPDAVLVAGGDPPDEQHHSPGRTRLRGGRGRSDPRIRRGHGIPAVGRRGSGGRRQRAQGTHLPGSRQLGALHDRGQRGALVQRLRRRCAPSLDRLHDPWPFDTAPRHDRRRSLRLRREQRRPALPARCLGSTGRGRHLVHRPAGRGPGPGRDRSPLVRRIAGSVYVGSETGAIFTVDVPFGPFTGARAAGRRKGPGEGRFTRIPWTEARPEGVKPD
jgi:hypothetical protein